MGGVVKNFLVVSSNQYWRCSALILDVPPALFMRRRQTIHTPSSSLWKYSSVRKECQSHQYAPTRGVEPSGKGNFYILSSILWSLYLGGGGLSSTLWYQKLRGFAKVILLCQKPASYCVHGPRCLCNLTKTAGELGLL